VDGYLVYQMRTAGTAWWQTLATSGKPVLYADFQFGGSGGFLVYNAAFMRAPSRRTWVLSLHRGMKDLVEAVKCFQVVKNGGSAAEFVAATKNARLKADSRCRSPGRQGRFGAMPVRE